MRISDHFNLGSQLSYQINKQFLLMVYYQWLITKNLGSEFNLAVSKPIVSNTIKWTYKLSQYIRGNHSTNNSELNMWLDFSISLNDK